MEHTGRVKWYDWERGYGIIKDETGEDVFVHHTRMAQDGQEFSLHAGQLVRFEMVQHEDLMPSANHVSILQ